MQEKPIHLFHQTEDYFFRSISHAVLDFEGASCYFTGVEVDNLNLLILREMNVSLENVLREASTFFKKFNSQWSILVPEEKVSLPAQKAFNSYNMHLLEETVTMFMPLKELKDLHNFQQIDIARTDDNLNDWSVPLVSAFESTPMICAQYQKAHQTALDNQANFHHFTLYDNAKPVSSLTLSVLGKNCRLDDIGTSSAFQNKGYATCLINHALNEAKKMGIELCFLEASKSGFSVYQKIGFYPLFINQVFGQD